VLGGKISKESQSQAERDFSKDEKLQISRIEVYGGKLSRFVNNLGNIFSEYHLDFSMRYPETNQFAMNIDTIQDADLRNAMKSAIRWSVIQRKPKLQRPGPSENLQDTYTINRIFAPTFQLSYRTRGGKSVVLTEEKLAELMARDTIDISNYMPKRQTLDEKADNTSSLSLFDEL
jgi:hypothetical protein